MKICSTLCYSGDSPVPGYSPTYDDAISSLIGQIDQRSILHPDWLIQSRDTTNVGNNSIVTCQKFLETEDVVFYHNKLEFYWQQRLLATENIKSDNLNIYSTFVWQRKGNNLFLLKDMIEKHLAFSNNGLLLESKRGAQILEVGQSEYALE